MQSDKRPTKAQEVINNKKPPLPLNRVSSQRYTTWNRIHLNELFSANKCDGAVLPLSVETTKCELLPNKPATSLIQSEYSVASTSSIYRNLKSESFSERKNRFASKRQSADSLNGIYTHHILLIRRLEVLEIEKLNFLNLFFLLLNLIYFLIELQQIRLSRWLCSEK